MDYVALWFILTGGGGYVPPEDVRAPQCGRPGLVVGVMVDRLVNPTLALWPDPHVVGEHCEVDIRARVQGLPFGEYHLATTEMVKALPFGTPPEPYIGIDPHTSALWLRLDDGSILPPALPPANLRLSGQQ